MNNLTEEISCWRGVIERIKRLLILNRNEINTELFYWQEERERLAEEKSNVQGNLLVRFIRSLSIRLSLWEASGKITRRVDLLKQYNEIITLFLYDDDPRNTVLMEIKGLCIQHMIRFGFFLNTLGSTSSTTKKKESQFDRAVKAFWILEEGLSKLSLIPQSSPSSV